MAFFGVDMHYCEDVPQRYLHHEALRIACPPQESHLAHAVFRHIRAEDIVFIKAFTPETGLHVFAVGTALPGRDLEHGRDSYLPVHWGWRGGRHLGDPDDNWPLRSAAVYEEFNLAVQRELIDLLPDKLHDPFLMVLGSAPVKPPGRAQVPRAR